MADNFNPNSPFSLNQPARGLFGSLAPSTRPPSSSTASAAAVAGTSMFGVPSATAATDSQPAPTGGIFGGSGVGRADQSTSGGGSVFAKFATASSLSGTQAGQPAAASSSGSIFSTPSKTADAGAASQNPFGATSGLFGSKPFGEANTTTPTSKPSTSIFANSTTPAGPPPGASTGAGNSSFFNFSKPEAQSNSSSGKADATSTKPATSSLFQSSSGPSTNTSNSQNSALSSAPSQVSNIFGNAATQPQDAASRNPTDSKPAPSMFSNLGRQSTSSSTGAPSLFPTAANQVQTSAAPKANPFGSFANSGPLASSGVSTAASDGQKTTAPPSIGNPTITASTSSSSAAPSTSASNVFSNFGKPTASSSVSKPQDPPTMGTVDASKSSTNNLGASTAGPMPLLRSRLKDKTMDDIITRWASDLSRYQTEFQAQAEKVASWDRILVENSEKIQRLYGSTLEAERATTEVERQLTSVESDQAELEAWLNHYEAEVDNMIQTQVGKSEGLSGPDQERERTYQLATRLSDRLDDMGKDLSSMIEEINDASSNLSKHAKSDDPLTQVVRVLNGHLTQLQEIDQGAASLQLKVKEAQKVGQNIRPSNGLNGPSSDAAEAFYRSFMGR